MPIKNGDRWNRDTGKYEPMPDVGAFLAEVLEVCRKHDLSLAHEDRHGGFIVERGFDKDNAEWLLEASFETRRRAEVGRR